MRRGRQCLLYKRCISCITFNYTTLKLRHIQYEGNNCFVLIIFNPLGLISSTLVKKKKIYNAFLTRQFYTLRTFLFRLFQYIIMQNNAAVFFSFLLKKKIIFVTTSNDYIKSLYFTIGLITTILEEMIKMRTVWSFFTLSKNRLSLTALEEPAAK